MGKDACIELRVGHTINGRCPWQRHYVVEHQSGRNVGAVLTTVVKATVNSTYIETEKTYALGEARVPPVTS
jgi:hypothetical protein